MTRKEILAKDKHPNKWRVVNYAWHDLYRHLNEVLKREYYNVGVNTDNLDRAFKGFKSLGDKYKN